MIRVWRQLTPRGGGGRNIARILPATSGRDPGYLMRGIRAELLGRIRKFDANYSG